VAAAGAAGAVVEAVEGAAAGVVAGAAGKELLTSVPLEPPDKLPWIAFNNGKNCCIAG
jgi:hypothetical protein